MNMHFTFYSIMLSIFKTHFRYYSLADKTGSSLSNLFGSSYKLLSSLQELFFECLLTVPQPERETGEGWHR